MQLHPGEVELSVQVNVQVVHHEFECLSLYEGELYLSLVEGDYTRLALQACDSHILEQGQVHLGRIFLQHKHRSSRFHIAKQTGLKMQTFNSVSNDLPQLSVLDSNPGMLNPRTPIARWNRTRFMTI